MSDYYAKFERGYCQSTNIVAPLLNGASEGEGIIHSSYHRHDIARIRDISRRDADVKTSNNDRDVDRQKQVRNNVE